MCHTVTVETGKKLITKKINHESGDQSQIKCEYIGLVIKLKMSRNQDIGSYYIIQMNMIWREIQEMSDVGLARRSIIINAARLYRRQMGHSVTRDDWTLLRQMTEYSISESRSRGRRR